MEAFSSVNAAQYPGVHQERKEEEGEHGLVEQDSEKDDEHADIAAQPKLAIPLRRGSWTKSPRAGS